MRALVEVVHCDGRYLIWNVFSMFGLPEEFLDVPVPLLLILMPQAIYTNTNTIAHANTNTTGNVGGGQQLLPQSGKGLTSLILCRL